MLTATRVPPNVMITLDRSHSMLDHINPADTRSPTKWDIGKRAIADLLASHDTQVRFGFFPYPGSDRSCNVGADCTVGNVAINLASPNATAINNYLTNAGTCSFMTPTSQALQRLVGYSGLADTARGNYVLLITDGNSTCGDPIPVARTLYMQSPSVRTFVVGFGSGIDATELNNLATAGGTARAGTQKYYQADDEASLRAALSAIAGNVQSCSYTLSTAPPNPSLLAVYFGTTAVRRDTTHASGWDYNATQRQLQFYGATCDSIRAGTAGTLVVSYGCPVPG